MSREQKNKMGDLITAINFELQRPQHEFGLNADNHIRAQPGHIGWYTPRKNPQETYQLVEIVNPLGAARVLRHEETIEALITHTEGYLAGIRAYRDNKGYRRG